MKFLIENFSALVWFECENFASKMFFCQEKFFPDR